MDKTAIKNYIVLDCETTGVNPHTCDLLGVAVNDGNNISYGNIIPDLQQKQVIGHNVKYDLTVLYRNGYKYITAYFDTMIAYYLLHIDKSKKLENIVRDVFNIDKDDLVQVYNKFTNEKRVNLPEDWYTKIGQKELAEYAMADAEWTYKLAEYLEKELDSKLKLKEWFYEIEMPLVNILTKMELQGVRVNKLKLQQLHNELEIEMKELRRRLIYLSGVREFNLNSPLQLRELLYKKLKLPVYDQTDKGEASTSKNTLKLLSERTGHAFPLLLLRYREIEKILSTYTLSLIEKLDENDRLHTIYNQALTNTRRFSSDSPNLQNIPTRSDIGKRIKECFIPANGHQFLIADYSQLEPRILAHLSDDKWLIERFKNGDDIYNYTTELVKNAGFKEFSRDKSKILFLALMYGKSAFGLANDWHCAQQEAQAIIDSVFRELSGVQNYITYVQEQAFKTGGWLESIAGLPLYVGNPHSNNKWECAEVDRKAVNYPIQASSQDILKKAIVSIYNKYGVFPVLMIHDELVYELDLSGPPNTMHFDIIKEMENAWKLKVPLKVEWKITDRWTK